MQTLLDFLARLDKALIYGRLCRTREEAIERLFREIDE